MEFKIGSEIYVFGKEKQEKNVLRSNKVTYTIKINEVIKKLKLKVTKIINLKVDKYNNIIMEVKE